MTTPCTTHSVVHWPKSKTLCFPVFQEERPHPLINTSPGEEKSHMCTVPLPEVVSSPSPSPSSLSHDMSHVTALCDDNGENNNCQANATHSHSPLLAQDPRNNSTTSLLAGENLLEGRDALLELGYQTATELVWIKQAISSRQKVCVCTVYGDLIYHVMLCSLLQYIQLKQQMRTQ